MLAGLAKPKIPFIDKLNLSAPGSVHAHRKGVFAHVI